VFDDLDGLFDVTSIRKGFVGGGFDGGPGLPKQMAKAAGIDGADLIPHGSELFLGFTSTQKAGLGPSRIANIETLGYADVGANAYFAQGTHMHLSHLFEDLAAWYLIFDFQDRVDTTFRPRLDVPQYTKTVPQGPDEVQSAAEVGATTPATGRSVTPARSSRPPGSSATPSDGTARSTRGEQRFRSAPISTRSTTPSSGRQTSVATSTSTRRQPGSTSSSSTRRATTFGGTASQWTESCRTGRG
jgi:hypothetical protein